MGLSLSPPLRNKVTASDHLPVDLLHFLGRECSQCFGSEVATGAEAQRKRSRALVIGCLANRNDVVFAERPIKVLDVMPVFLAISLKASGRPIVSSTLGCP